MSRSPHKKCYGEGCTCERPFLLLNFADDLQGKPENPDRHGTRRSAVGGDGTRRTIRPLNQTEDADPGDHDHEITKITGTLLQGPPSDARGDARVLLSSLLLSGSTMLYLV